MTIHPRDAHQSTVTTYGAGSFDSPLALPAFVVMAVNVVVIVVALAAAGYMRPLWSAALIVGALAVAIGSTIMIVAERRRLRRAMSARTAQLDA
jgi:hypothetical protein